MKKLIQKLKYQINKYLLYLNKNINKNIKFGVNILIYINKIY